MKKFKRAGSVFLMAVMMGVLVFGCSSNEDEKRADAKDGAKTEVQDAEDEGAEEPAKLLVAAAASLEYSYEDELIPMFEEENPNITVEGTYDSIWILLLKHRNQFVLIRILQTGCRCNK